MRNFGEQKTVGQYIQSTKNKQTNKKSCQPRILYLTKLSFKSEGEIKAFPDKQNLREFVTSRIILQVVLKGVLQGEMK